MSKKVHQNDVDISPIEIYVKQSTSKRTRFFAYQNYIEQSMLKQNRFFTHRNYVEESALKQRQIFSHQNYIRKVLQNDVEIRLCFLFDLST